MAKKLTPVQAFIRRWESFPAMAKDVAATGVKCKPWQPRDWFHRKRIPATYHRPVVIAAYNCGMADVTHEVIAEMHAAKRARAA